MAQEKPHQKLIKEGEKALKDPDIKPDEVENWWRKKGLDKSEAREAIDKWKHSTAAREWDKTQKADTGKKAAGQTNVAGPNAASKKSYGLWFIIFLLALAGIGYYLYRVGLIKF